MDTIDCSSSEFWLGPVLAGQKFQCHAGR